ncbi:MAG TPA: hypothetical protein VJK66_05265 [Gaiellaceae bacterium]|nr:hypothetical protein [Gaiellaceae bacterium]
MAKKRKSLTPDERAALRQLFRELRNEMAVIRGVLEKRLDAFETSRMREIRRRERLRRLTFGLLGRG